MTYVESLEAAWADHLAPRAPDAPTVISTFAGCGGSSLGYSMAGFRELLAVEWDDHAVACFRLNFPDVPIYHGDIGKLSAEEACRLAGIAPGELDVLDGSPPCQGFSTAGKRKFTDPHNGLFREFTRLLRGLRPRAFVMENVSGMVKGGMKIIFAEVLHELKSCGYRVRARVLNAMFFGVPQSRERVIFIGIREDIGTGPSYPRAVHVTIPLRNAIDGLADTKSGEISTPNLSGKYRMMAPLIQQGECAANYDPGKGFQGLNRQHLDRPSNTLRKLNNGHGFTAPLHPIEHRSLSIAEAKRIGSFPDPFQLIGSFADRWSRIGNSVPPLFMRAIAGHVRDLIAPGIPAS